MDMKGISCPWMAWGGCMRQQGSNNALLSLCSSGCPCSAAAQRRVPEHG